MALRKMRNDKSIPWSYRKGSSFLHRLPAGAKLIFFLSVSLASFFPHFAVLSCVLLCLAVLSFAAGMSPPALLRGGGTLFLMMLTLTVIRGAELSPPGFNFEALKLGFSFCVRIAAAFAAGSLFFSVTTSAQIRRSLSSFETFFHMERLNLSLSIALMLGFLPRFFVIWEDLNIAWKARGGKRNFARLPVLAAMTLERMMIHAAEAAAAMESRGATES
jgi:biotin transport system permease protein